MNRTAQRRLARLEKRQPKDAYADLSDEEFLQRVDDLLVQVVEEFGVDETRAKLQRDCPAFPMERLDHLIARGRVRV